MMAFRGVQIYVSSETRGRLKLLCECYPFKSKDPGTNHNATIDETVDILLNEVIEKQFPAVLELEKKIAKLKKEYSQVANKKEEE